MPRVVPFVLALALGGGVALSLASCGGSDAKLLPGQTAREITANLNTVEQLAAEGDCLGAENAARQFNEQVEALQGVAEKLKRALGQGAARLREVVSTCEETSTETAPPTSEPLEPTEGGKPKAKPKKEPKEKQPKEEEAPPPEHKLPPQANGKGKGLEKEPETPTEPEAEETGPPSGGVGPNSPVGEGG